MDKGVIAVIVVYSICCLSLGLWLGYSNEPNTVVINNTIEVEKIINNTIEVPGDCNITTRTIIVQNNSNCSSPDNYSYNRFALIRQLKRCEANEVLYSNHSDCFTELNSTSIDLQECEDYVCREFNSSWC